MILDEHPHIHKGDAMGLCFSVPKEANVPHSIMNIYKALESDPKINFKTPKTIHGDLTKWTD